MAAASKAFRLRTMHSAAPDTHPRAAKAASALRDCDGLGVSIVPLHSPGCGPTEALRQAVLLADRLGHCEACAGEHVIDASETVTSSMMFLASLVSETRNIKLGTGAINVPNAHPAYIAAQAAMLHHMLQGRLIIGISHGCLMSDAKVFGNLERNRTEMCVERIDTVLKVWANDCFVSVSVSTLAAGQRLRTLQSRDSPRSA